MTASAKKAAVAKTQAPKTIPAPKRRKSDSSKKEVIEPISSSDIDDQIKSFLKSGGKIQQIPKGVSGQQTGQLPTRKHIVISKKK